MFNKYQAIFRNRWRAVLWGLGVLLTAYCTVPSADETAAKHKEQAEHQAAKNPWALDKPAR